MQYISTRGGDEPQQFKDAILTGMARDGGLLLPEEIPCVRGKLNEWSKLSYRQLALEIISLFATDICREKLEKIIDKSYSTFRHEEVTPVVKVGDFYTLELFHGPTLAFKDIALQFIGNLFAEVLEERGLEMNIVVATSGDTGSAAINGVRGRNRLRIFVLHPDGRVSPLQQRQMTTVLDDNVRNIAVAGTFDDCQAIVKALFSDLEFRDKNHLGAVNSINWARVLAQVVYYFYAAFRVIEREGCSRVRFSVPTGNFGDIFAGFIAAQMGAPIEKLFLATNENDILAQCFNSGVYQRGEVRATISPSMDIQVASNFERYLYYLCGRDTAQVRAWMESFAKTRKIEVPISKDSIFASAAGNTEETLATIRKVWNENHYLLDPHTAVGVAVAQKLRGESKTPVICLATAHPAKFPAAIQRATDADLAHHPILDAIAGLPERLAHLPASKDEIASFVTQTLKS